MEETTAKKILRQAPVDGILLTNAANMRYAAGFTGEGYVYLSARRSIVVTDSRYTLSASAECPGFEVIQLDNRGYYEPLIQAVKEDVIWSLGIEDQEMTVAGYDALLEEMMKAELEELQTEPLKDYVTAYRAVKKPEEIAYIKEAEAIGDRAFERLLPRLEPGMTEKQAAAWIEFLMKEEGAEGFSFDTIAASGIHSAMPHAVPTDKKLENGDFLTMDFGCRYKGYCSDMTRTVVIGRVSERQREVYNTVLRAQQAALDGMRPGMTGKEIDALARNVIKEAGYDACFGHALGHSVGLDIHEKPVFSPKGETEIRPGMVITVEPGIYIEGFGGVRIEDLVVITEGGCENLTHSPKELIVIENGAG